MRHSNQIFPIGMMTIAFTALVAIGCMRPKTYAPDDPGLGIASFYASRVELAEKGKKVAEVDGFSIPTRKVYTLRTCLRSKRTERPAAQAVFEFSGKDLEGKEREPLYVTTDAKGCFTWTEEVAFNFFGEEVYLPLERKITATVDSGQKGSVKIRLAVNPWNLSGTASEVVDLNKDSPPPGARIMSAEETPLYLNGKTQNAYKQLAVKDIKLRAIPSQIAAADEREVRDLYILIKPSIRGLDAQRKVVDFPLEEATLAMDANLVAIVADRNMGERKYTVWSAESVPFRATERGFVALASLELPPVEGDRVRYELFVRVRTVPELLGLNPFEGVLELGSHWQVVNSHVLPEIIQDSNVLNSGFSMDESIRAYEKTLPQSLLRHPKTEKPESAPSTDDEKSDSASAQTEKVESAAPTPTPAPEVVPQQKG